MTLTTQPLAQLLKLPVRKPGEFSDLVFKRNSGLETMRLDENGRPHGTLISAQHHALWIRIYCCHSKDGASAGSFKLVFRDK